MQVAHCLLVACPVPSKFATVRVVLYHYEERQAVETTGVAAVEKYRLADHRRAFFIAMC